MPSDLFSIGLSGTRAARAALDVSSQNIANANTQGYVRRSVEQTELMTATGAGHYRAHSLAGVRVVAVNRNASDFAATEMRRNASDAHRSQALLNGLTPIQSGLENASVFDGIVGYEAALKQLSSDPVSVAQRASVIGAAGVMTSAFVFGARQLSEHGEGLRFEAESSVAALNLAAEELAKVNFGLSQARPGTAAQASLMDQRDVQLSAIAEYVGITTTFDARGVVQVALSGAGSSTVLVDSTVATPLELSLVGDGTVTYTQGGAAAIVESGKLAGYAEALEGNRDAALALDNLAVEIITLVNNAQASGVDADGAPGQPLLVGTSAADIELATREGDLIVTAPAGEPAGSRNAGVLDGLRTAFDEGGIAENANSLIFDLSARINAQETTNSAMSTIAAASLASFEASAGVDLDQEAANLIRYEQAFQASGRVMQVAADLIDTILGIG